MNIQERIHYFTGKLDVKFAKNNIMKIRILVDEIQRNLKKEVESKNCIFTSQDLRSFVLKIEKVQKAINKQISFTSFLKKFDKYKKVANKEFITESIELAELARVSQELQILYCELNHYASFLYLIEVQYKQEKKKDDKLLQDELEFIMFELMNGN